MHTVYSGAPEKNKEQSSRHKMLFTEELFYAYRIQYICMAKPAGGGGREVNQIIVSSQSSNSQIIQNTV
jgi:hypothetical protein